MFVPKQTNRQKPTLRDKYKVFLSNIAQPKNNFSNSLNLFDDSNRKNKAWLKIAKSNLSREK